MTEESLYTVSATVRIRKGQGRALKSGGAWVYDNEIEAIEGSFENGGLVNVEDFDGYPLGCGFINTCSHITVRMLSRKKNQVINREFFRMQLKCLGIPQSHSRYSQLPHCVWGSGLSSRNRH